MKIPIANCLEVNNEQKIKLNNLSSIYQDVDTKNFTCQVRFYILKNCSSAGYIIFTVLNERLVEKYLKNEVKYGEIVDKLVKLFKHNVLLKNAKKKY